MMPIKYVHIPYEHFGLAYRDGRFAQLLTPGRYLKLQPFSNLRVEKAWQGQPWILRPTAELRQLRESEAVGEVAAFVDLKDTQRALVWLDGRFGGFLSAGLHAYWKTRVDVRIESIDTREPRLDHADADLIVKHAEATEFLHVFEVAEHRGIVVYVNGRFHDAHGPGLHGYWKSGLKVTALPFALPWLGLPEPELKQLRQSGALDEKVAYVDVSDTERALVWFNGRFSGILGPGSYGYWKEGYNARIQRLDASDPRLVREDFEVITRHADAERFIDVHNIGDGEVAVLYLGGQFEEVLEAGRYAFWKGVGSVRLYPYNLREKVLDVSGQEIMTADKVTLRLNAVLSYRIADVRKVAETVADPEQAIYRELQLIVRAEVGGRSLDQLLADKTAVANEAYQAIRQKAAQYGLEVLGLGIRDVILPGDMKSLLNQVIEAEKAAQANIIKRREETAALRSQINSARLIEQNPTLLRLRELESLEKITEKAELKIFVGEDQTLSKRIVKIV